MNQQRRNVAKKKKENNINFVIRKHKIYGDNPGFLTIKHFILLKLIHTGHITFNETCCKEKGIPGDCMGLCRLDTTRGLEVPPDKCDEWENTAKECVIEGEVNLKIDYTLIV